MNNATAPLSTLPASPRRSSWKNAGQEISGGLSPLLFQGAQVKGGNPLLGEYPLSLVGGLRIQRPQTWVLSPQVRYLGEGRWNLSVAWVLVTGSQVRLLPWACGEVWTQAPTWEALTAPWGSGEPKVTPSQGKHLELSTWQREVQTLVAKARALKEESRVGTWSLVSWWIDQGYTLAQVKAEARDLLEDWEEAHPCPPGRKARLEWRDKRALQVAELRACRQVWLNATARDRWAERGASAQKALEARLDRASGARPLSAREEGALTNPSQEEASALLLAWQERANNPRLPGPRPERLGRLSPGWSAPLIKDEGLLPKAPKRGVLAESQARARAINKAAKAELARGCEPVTLAETDALAEERASQLITQAELLARLKAQGVKRGRPRKG